MNPYTRLLFSLSLSVCFIANSQNYRDCKDCSHCHGTGKIMVERDVFEPIVERPTEKGWVQYKYQKLKGQYGKQNVETDCYWCKGNGLDCSSNSLTVEQKRAASDRRIGKRWDGAFTFPYNMTWTCMDPKDSYSFGEYQKGLYTIKNSDGNYGIGYITPLSDGTILDVISRYPQEGCFFKLLANSLLQYSINGQKGLMCYSRGRKKIIRETPAIWSNIILADNLCYGKRNNDLFQVFSLRAEPLSPEINCSSLNAVYLLNNGKKYDKIFLEVSLKNNPSSYIAVSCASNMFLIGKKGEIENKDIDALEDGYSIPYYLNGVKKYVFVSNDGQESSLILNGPIKLKDDNIAVFQKNASTFTIAEISNKRFTDLVAHKVIELKNDVIIYEKNGLLGVYFIKSQLQIAPKYTSVEILKNEVSALLKKMGEILLKATP